MSIERCKLTIIFLALMSVGLVVLAPRASAINPDDALNEQLSAALRYHGFTGRVGSSLEQRLGRKIDNQLQYSVSLTCRQNIAGWATPVGLFQSVFNVEGLTGERREIDDHVGALGHAESHTFHIHRIW